MFYEIFGYESKKKKNMQKNLKFSFEKACFFYSFLRNSKEKPENMVNKGFFPLNLYLQQINPYNYEPHYQVVFTGEIWQALPVIALFIV